MNIEPQKKRGRGIISVSSLFEKYKKTLRAPERSVVEALITAVEGMIPNASITSGQCAYNPRTRTLVLRVGGPLKTEILLNKVEVLSQMEKLLGAQNTPKEIL